MGGSSFGLKILASTCIILSSMRKIKNIKKYADKWVLLNEKGTEVVRASDSFNKVYKGLKGKKDGRVIFKVPSASTVYSP